jgi:glycosyltransferase involved in cell wall biosynthesis
MKADSLSSLTNGSCGTIGGDRQAVLRSTSIVIPVFNRAHLVDRAIDSALEQTVPCEVVLVDHGSTDHIDDVVRRYGSRIRYIRREQDHGAIAAWRDGIEQATGELVHLTYDDDWIQPTFVERCEPLLRRDVAFVYTRAVVHDTQGQPIEVLNEHAAGVRPIREIVDLLMRMPLGISPGCALFRRSDALGNLLPGVPGAGDGDYGKGSEAGVDLLLLLLTSLHYPKYAHVAEPLADFLAHPGSFTIGAQLSGRIERLIAAYSTAKAYYRSQPGARLPSPLREIVSRGSWRPPRDAAREGKSRAMYFSPHFPWPPGHGAHQRIIQTLRWMADRYGPVHLVVGRQSNDNGRHGTPPRDLVSRVTFLNMETSPPEQLVRRLGLQSIVDRTTRSARALFGRLLDKEKPRIVFVNYVWWGRLLPRERDFFAIIDTHDVVSHNEHLQRRLEEVARQCDGDPFAQFERDAPRLDRTVQGCTREFRTLDAFDLVLAISREDESFLAGGLRHATVLKLGYHLPPARVLPALRIVERARGLCPIGKGPNLFNEMGVRALSREFDRLERNRVYVTLTGALNPRSTLHAGHWCELRGVVRDYARELATHQFGVMVPFAGTGAQTKQYEFAHAGVPVVGYRVRVDHEVFTNGVDAVVVDAPSEMCRAIVRLTDDPDYLAQLTLAARGLPRRLRELQVREESILQALLP